MSRFQGLYYVSLDGFMISNIIQICIDFIIILRRYIFKIILLALSSIYSLLSIITSITDAALHCKCSIPKTYCLRWKNVYPREKYFHIVGVAICMM